MGDIIGAVAGGLLGPKPPGPQKKYHAREAQDILYGQVLSDLSKWGSPFPKSYLEASPKYGSQFTGMFGSSIPGFGNVGQAPQKPSGTPFDMNPQTNPLGYEKQYGSQIPYSNNPDAQAANLTVQNFMKPSRVRFGYGGGNMGGYTAGYGGPIA